MRLLILDRDGVINHDSDDFIKHPDEWVPINGSLDAIAKANKHGWRVVVATNQSGVGRGLYDVDMLEQIHKKMDRMVKERGGNIDKVFYCPHHPDENCDCRKPKPGLFRQIEQHYGVDLLNVPCIGDSPRDLEAAKTVGARPILVKTGNGEASLKSLGISRPVEVFDDLAAAVDCLVQETSDVVK
ncbi:MAG: D-glycero-beta-D-manno-heptose 1,7-bisphosphate 7-phosphatase [Gammaproteobacteria bacterium]|nr:D-glycero-beta-D-manno-heptose 1,7-bisphosphate 7-phosphatase [Gammaproteobacteria bacterium]